MTKTDDANDDDDDDDCDDDFVNMTVMMMPLYDLFPATQRENKVVTSKFTERFRKEKRKKLLRTKLNLLIVWLRHLYSDYS